MMTTIQLHSLSFILLSLLPLSHSTCTSPSHLLLSRAFISVANFQPPPTCTPLLSLILPSRNLSGTVAWTLLRNITTLRTLDLSHNSLSGSIPTTFWSHPSLTSVNLAANRLGGALRFRSPPPNNTLRSLNLSRNRFTSVVNLSGFHRLNVLDLSHNTIAGDFPTPPENLSFFNLSYNNFTGTVEKSYLSKFGDSAFIEAGFHVNHKSTSAIPLKKPRRRVGATARVVIATACSVVVVLGVMVVGLWIWMRRRKRKGEEEWVVAEEAPEWVAEARPAAKVVVFERPLMELTFKDLAAATSGFGRESQMAEGGRSGAAYRAVLPGDLHVVVRVVESGRGMEEGEAAAAFRELGRLRGPNILPLLGYCVAGREKLLLYEYMERGDLHQWLHELPAGKPDVDDITGDTWDHHHHPGSVLDWPTRHRIALGVARGLAFLHQGWVGPTGRNPVVHGHLVPSNILLDDDMEPRVADFAAAGGGGTAEDDVYSYGLVVLEIVTGREGWNDGEVQRVRGMVRAGKGAEVVDVRMAAEWEKEMVECMRVGYLCTAAAAEKRPTMQQVVGLLKDIRATSVSGSGGAAAISGATGSGGAAASSGQI